MDTATEDRIRGIVQDEIAKALAEEAMRKLEVTAQVLQDFGG